MKSRIVLFASVIAVALSAAAFAAGPAQPAAPASTPAVCPASSPAPTAGAQAPTLAPLPMASTLPCIIYGACVPCNHFTAQPCIITACGTQKTSNCGDCTTDCVPPLS